MSNVASRTFESRFRAGSGRMFLKVFFFPRVLQTPAKVAVYTGAAVCKPFTACLCFIMLCSERFDADEASTGRRIERPRDPTSL